jgi:hypothetical protein
VLPHAYAGVGGAEIDPDGRTVALARHCCRFWVVEAAALGFLGVWGEDCELGEADGGSL